MDKVLSIIVPVYGAETYLEKNMMTVIKQLTPECELILVDDGSKDKSGEICDKLSKINGNVRVIHKANGGVSSARNAGIDIAEGRYITFVDSDDYVANDYVKSILQLILTGKDVYFFGAYLVSDKQKKIMKSWLNNEKLSGDGMYNAQKLLFGCQSNEPWDKVFKNSIIQYHSLKFPLNIHLGEDLVFSLDYIKYATSVEILNKPIYFHTINPNGLGHKVVTQETLVYHDAVFCQMLDTIKVLNVDKTIESLAYQTMLQILTNCCGKLYRNGYSAEKIKKIVMAYDWYDLLLSKDYKGLKNCIRKYFMKHEKYFFISRVFSK